jgi:ABC-type dipeptide/oligopeptide/nickel transport system permease subunit
VLQLLPVTAELILLALLVALLIAIPAGLIASMRQNTWADYTAMTSAKEYIEACRALGQYDPQILLRHILPNCMAPIIVTGTLSIATAIIVEASLSFLGLGTQPPTPSWGWDLKANVAWIQMNPWLALGPGFAIFTTVLGFNLFGDGLRDALDPRLK